MPRMTPPAKSPNALLHGALDALILKVLSRGPNHGYAVARAIEDTTGEALLVDIDNDDARIDRVGHCCAQLGIVNVGLERGKKGKTPDLPGIAEKEDDAGEAEKQPERIDFHVVRRLGVRA